MKSDKEIKKEFKAEASKNPDKYYATRTLRKEGFKRRQCRCGTYFWTVVDSQMHCGDPACSGGFRFIGNTPAKREMSYIEVWQEFAALFKRLGYTPIPRYPVVARWRDDTDFVQASIYDFQPFVVSGEVKPPANPLVVPQFCLRFNDIDNVGITGAHYTGFVMIGQHMFVPESEWDQDRVFSDIHTWLKEGLGLPNHEITFHEDAWAGGGNFGPCMEYFSRGLELGNQVYMLFDQTPQGPKPLKLKVLDMGMGHERNAWFTKGTSTSYDAVFPTVMEKLYSISGIELDMKLLEKFLPYSSFLNLDEVEDADQAWKMVADKAGADAATLKKKILPLAALYSIAEHSRSLLFALSDGALPSNVGGGYNLRMILRRAMGFIDKYGWKISLPDLCRWHAEYLRPLFPELMDNLNEVAKILDVEREKYRATRKKSQEMVRKIAQTDVSEEKLIELYDSHGISPEMIKDEAARLGRVVKVPEGFYSRVAELHGRTEQAHATEKQEKLDIPEGIPETKILYYDDYLRLRTKGKALWAHGRYIILDQTIAYPTSGGQLHDTGKLGGIDIDEVFKQGSYIVHSLREEPGFSPGDEAEIELDRDRRVQLAQHHSAAHIVSAVAREILGKHVNQAGAKKTEEKAHLDITHYESITESQLSQIEKRANEIVRKGIKIKSELLPRGEAESRYGMSIYQGGAVPGRHVRIISIEGIDIEACGGTHLHDTSEVGELKILKSKKIQDGVVRIYFTAGRAAGKEQGAESDTVKRAVELLGVEESQIPGRAEELFQKWKAARKAIKKGKEVDAKELELSSSKRYEGDIIAEAARILKTQPEHVLNTLGRFMKEFDEMKQKLK